MKVPYSPFCTRLSGSAKETELRLCNIFQWKKKRPPVVLFVLTALVVLFCCSLVSCNVQEKVSGKVFDTDKEILAVTVHTTINNMGEIIVPEEYLDEIVEWLASFEIGEPAGKNLVPGTGSTSVTIDYVDGTSVENSIDTVRKDDTLYYINSPDAPECWVNLMNRGFGESTPSVEDDSPETDAEVNANQEVLDYVDTIFASEQVTMQCFLLPATGPIAVPMDEYREQVREVFSRYIWTREEGEEPEREVTLDSWTLCLNAYFDGIGMYNIDAGSNSNWIKINVPTSEGSTVINFSYNGEPGELIDELAAIWDAPDIRHAQILLPDTIEDDRALAEAYEKTFRELYLNSGAIASYELHELEVLSRDSVDDVYPSFRMTYRVKPADPAKPCWEYHTVDEDGWVTCSIMIHLTTAGYEHIEESVWRCSWYQSVE